MFEFVIRSGDAASTNTADYEHERWLNLSKIESSGDITAGLDMDELEGSHIVDKSKFRFVDDHHEKTKVPAATFNRPLAQTDTLTEIVGDVNVSSSSGVHKASGLPSDHVQSDLSLICPMDWAGGENTVINSPEDGNDCEITMFAEHVIRAGKVRILSNKSVILVEASDGEGSLSDAMAALSIVAVPVGGDVQLVSSSEEKKEDGGNSFEVGVDEFRATSEALLEPSMAGGSAVTSLSGEKASDDKEEDTTLRVAECSTASMEFSVVVAGAVTALFPAEMAVKLSETEPLVAQSSLTVSSLPDKVSIFQLSESDRPADQGKTQIDALKSPNLLGRIHEPARCVVDDQGVGQESGIGQINEYEFCSIEGHADIRSTITETHFMLNIQENSHFNFSDTTEKLASSGSLNTLNSESKLFEQCTGSVSERSYCHTSIWGRRAEIVLEQNHLQRLLQEQEVHDSQEENVSSLNHENSELVPDSDKYSQTERQSSEALPDTVMAPKSVNTEFVEGLDDIDKFLEEVEPPDELDVGAAGSSIQEVLLGQGSQILTKHATIIFSRIKQSLQKSRFKQFLASRRSNDGTLILVTRGEIEMMLEVLRSSCGEIVQTFQSLWDDLFEEEDEESERFDVEETTKLDSIRKIILNQRTGSLTKTIDNEKHQQTDGDHSPVGSHSRKS